MRRERRKLSSDSNGAERVAEISNSEGVKSPEEQDGLQQNVLDFLFSARGLTSGTLPQP